MVKLSSTTSYVMLVILLMLFYLNFGFAKGQGTFDNMNVQVNRVIQIENGGALIINDTVTLSSGVGKQVGSLNSFQIGFPIEYETNLTNFFAYDRSGRLQAALDTTIGQTGFFWVAVSFPQKIDVSDGRSFDFSVINVFTGVIKANQTTYHANFPLYPSLIKEALGCDVTLTFPTISIINYSTSSDLMNKTIDSRLVFYNSKSPLEPYANVSSWVEFNSSNYQLYEIDEWRREFKIDGIGGLAGTDYCTIINMGDQDMRLMSFVLPTNASDVSVQDIYETYPTGQLTIKRNKDVEVDVTFQEPLKPKAKIKLLITYKLPFWNYAAQRGWQDYTLNISLVRNDEWIVKQSTLMISLPEGAEFQSSSETSYTLEKDGFGIKVSFTESNLTSFQEQGLNLQYKYMILWASFRPTIWVGILAIVFGGIFYIKKITKPSSTVSATTPLPSGSLRRFIDLYEERRRLRQDTESLEQEVQKGRISRRRYRLRRSSLDERLSRLQRELAELKGELVALGGKYSDRIKRLEAAEAEIVTLGRDIEQVEARFRQREVTTETRRRLLDEYNRIKEKAENTIAETLLRFREELH